MKKMRGNIPRRAPRSQERSQGRRVEVVPGPALCSVNTAEAAIEASAPSPLFDITFPRSGKIMSPVLTIDRMSSGVDGALIAVEVRLNGEMLFAVPAKEGQNQIFPTPSATVDFFEGDRIQLFARNMTAPPENHVTLSGVSVSYLFLADMRSTKRPADAGV